jgi:predicted DNA-binding transcriptional regulator AlpA
MDPIKTDRVDSDRLIRIDEVKILTSLSKSSINAWVASGKFPKPANLSLTIKVWRYRDVVEWIDEALERGN